MERYKVIGQDDWLIFARRRSDNALMYAIVETNGLWLEAPHKGEADYGTPEWAEDWRFMIQWVMGKPSDFTWEVADYPLEMSDEDFYQRMCKRFGIRQAMRVKETH